MTRRRSKRELETAVRDLEGRPDDADRVLVIGIGGDPARDPDLAGWMTVEECEEIYGEPVEEGVTVEVKEAR